MTQGLQCAVVALLARLEDEHGVATGRRDSHGLRRADQHGGMQIVPARVHGPVTFGGEWLSAAFSQRQRIHVGAQNGSHSVRPLAGDPGADATFGSHLNVQT